MKVDAVEDSNDSNERVDVSSAVTAIEDSLILSCVAGDLIAWRALHRRYYPVVVSFLRKLRARECDLEDACQDVFVELIRYLPSFRGQADFKTWLYRLCVTQARRSRNRERLMRVARFRLQSEGPQEQAVPAATVTEPTLLIRADAAIDKMSDGDRLVFVLYEFEGLPGKQIATIAGCPEATVWRRLHYARRVFRDELGIPESEAVASR